jgi:hypothetical protein
MPEHVSAQASHQRNPHFKALHIRALKLAIFYDASLFHTCRSAPALRHARRKPGTGFSDAITGAWASGTGAGAKNLVSAGFFTLSIVGYCN